MFEFLPAHSVENHLHGPAVESFKRSLLWQCYLPITKSLDGFLDKGAIPCLGLIPLEFVRSKPFQQFIDGLMSLHRNVDWVLR